MIRSSEQPRRYRERRDLRGTGPLDAPSYVVFLSPLAPYIILLASPANCCHATAIWVREEFFPLGLRK